MWQVEDDLELIELLLAEGAAKLVGLRQLLHLRAQLAEQAVVDASEARQRISAALPLHFVVLNKA
jgi:hypothetical protein